MLRGLKVCAELAMFPCARGADMHACTCGVERVTYRAGGAVRVNPVRAPVLQAGERVHAEGFESLC